MGLDGLISNSLRITDLLNNKIMPTTTTKENPRLQHYTITMGCDPEFFFSKKGEIIGSEKIIPKNGLMVQDQYGNPLESKIVIDGVQAELNPKETTCRVFLSNNISRCFKQVLETMKLKEDPDLTIDFTQTIKVNKKELASLSPENQILGCSPSKNAYTKKSFISVKNGAKYYYRSAGGHIHIGNYASNQYIKGALDNPKTLIPLLDIMLGNTCVLLDRDPGNIQRRKVYGRAGEYRTPSHGIEYRTLSNFWLKNYKLAAFVFGLTRETVNILANSTKEHNYAKEIIKAVKRTDIKKAINKNDFDLALSNFKKIEPIIDRLTKSGEDYYLPLNSKNLLDFNFFIKKDLNHWFKEDPIKHWTTQNPTAAGGWETFLSTTVRTQRLKEEAPLTPTTI